jgi:hypothetical protein
MIANADFKLTRFHSSVPFAYFSHPPPVKKHEAGVTYIIRLHRMLFDDLGAGLGHASRAR